MLMAAPAILHSLIFFAAPMLILVGAGFFSFNLRMEGTWAGWSNFAALFSDPKFWREAGTTALLALVTWVSILGTAIIGTVAMEAIGSGHRLRAAFAASAMMATSANGVLWLWLFSPIWGGLAQLSRLMGMPVVFWHARAWPAKIACLIVLWAWNFPATLYFVSLSANAVPKELLEAAMLDGANFMQRFLGITLPVIRRPLAYLAMSNIAGLFCVYEVTTMLFQGGPLGATTTILMDATGMLRGYGQSVALSLLLTLVIIPFSWLAWRFSKAYD